MTLLRFALLVLFAAAAATAQNIVDTSPYRVFHTTVGPQSIVRSSKGELFVIYRYQVTTVQTDIAIARSPDQGSNWNLKWQSGFAGNPAADKGNYNPTIAIDSQDNLHCSWFHQVPTSGSRIPRDIRYNRYDAASAKWGTEVQVTTAKYELNYPALEVDANDYVWFMHGTTASSWKSIVERSDKPFASDLKFSPSNPAFTSSASSQHDEIVVDAMGRVHVSYYENGSTGGAGVKHQWMDPGATSPKWTFTALSGHVSSTATADYYSSMAADNFGNVYVVYSVDDQGGKTQDPQWYLRKWDGATQTWGSPVFIYKVARSVWEPVSGQANSGAVISAACDETTGELYFTYRDFGTGEFLVARWRDGDPAPTKFASLMNTGSLPPTTRNYFIYPQFRGSLHPQFNRTSIGLDLLYTVGDQTATNPQYSLVHETAELGSMRSSGVPRIGTTYPLDLTAVRDGGKAYVAALGMSGLSPMIQIDRRYLPLAPDSLFFLTASNLVPAIFQNFQGILGPSGVGQAKVVIPGLAALVGVQLDGCFLTYDANGARALSNPWGFMITK